MMAWVGRLRMSWPGQVPARSYALASRTGAEQRWGDAQRGGSSCRVSNTCRTCV